MTQGRHVYFAPGKLDPFARGAAPPRARAGARRAAGGRARDVGARRVGAGLARRAGGRARGRRVRARRAGGAATRHSREAPYGTVSRDDGKRPLRGVAIQLLDQTMPVDLATAVDTAAPDEEAQLGQTNWGRSAFERSTWSWTARP